MNEQEIFDTIKKETESITVPDSLHPEKMEEKLSDTKQKHFRYRKSTRTVLATAACLLFVLVATLALRQALAGSSNTGVVPPVGTVQEENTAGQTSYETVCQLINQYYEGMEKDWRVYNMIEGEAFSGAGDSTGAAAPQEDVEYEGMDMAESSTSSGNQKTNGPSAGADTNDDYSDTDTQVSDVMEGDIVKTDGSYIYTVWESTAGYTFSIYQVNGSKVKRVSLTPVYNQNCNEMYLDGNRLILAGTIWNRDDGGNDRVGISIYDISHPEEPKKLAELTQSGYYNTSRFHDGILYTFSNYRVQKGDCQPDKPEEFVPQINEKNIPAGDICLTDNKESNSYMVMTSLSVENPEDFIDSIAAFGNFDTYYMNTNHIYTVKASYDEKQGEYLSTIAKYTFEKGNFEYNTNTQIRGQINNSYYMHEYEGNFCFVYTRNSSRRSVNGLGVMNENLELIGEISNLGIDERIYSSYFIDNIAYFVTFRETDPVFAVDFADPKNPVLKSELKLPGFSDYLHSFGEDMLVGIGKGDKKGDDGNNTRVKLSLFSIGKDYKLTETAKALMGEWTESIAGENHKAVFVDEERCLVGFCISTYPRYEYELKYLVFQYKNGKWKRVLSLPIKSTISDAGDIRGLRIGDYFYVVDVSGPIQIFDIHTWERQN